MNLAIKNKNFRCFELMLSILINAKDAFVSRSFLNDLGYMMDIEATVVELFFNNKLVDNFSSMAIEKVKWTIEEDSIGILVPSQLITKEKIEEHTCPPENDEKKTEEKQIEVSKEENFVVKPTM